MTDAFMNGAILFQQVRVVDSEKPELEICDVLVEDGKISRVAASLESPEVNVRVVQGGGTKLLLPGLFDAHGVFLGSIMVGEVPQVWRASASVGRAVR